MNTSISRRIAVGALAASAVLGVAACSDDDGTGEGIGGAVEEGVDEAEEIGEDVEEGVDEAIDGDGS